MIGMVNVQCDSPLDYYAAPKRRPSKKLVIPENTDVDTTKPIQTTPSYRPLFTNKNKQRLTYTPDGRKMSNGEVVEKQKPDKLWGELLVRSFAHKMEDEIQSPVDRTKTFEEEITKLNGIDRLQSSSTCSLVSEHRMSAEADNAETERTDSTRNRANSLDGFSSSADIAQTAAKRKPSQQRAIQST